MGASRSSGLRARQDRRPLPAAAAAGPGRACAPRRAAALARRSGLPPLSPIGAGPQGPGPLRPALSRRARRPALRLAGLALDVDDDGTAADPEEDDLGGLVARVDLEVDLPGDDEDEVARRGVQQLA